MKDDVGTVYLIHFESKYKHTRHYIGWTGLSVEDRLKRHNGSSGAKLLKAVSDSGIKFQVVRVWENATFELEQKLKRRKNAKVLCPICNPINWRNNCV